MRCLTYSECAEWCARRDFPTQHIEGYVVGPDPDITSPPVHFVKFPPTTDSGRKVAFGRFLYSLVAPAPELLLWLGGLAIRCGFDPHRLVAVRLELPHSHVVRSRRRDLYRTTSLAGLPVVMCLSRSRCARRLRRLGVRQLTRTQSNHANQRTRPEPRVCSHCVPRAVSLSLGRWAS